MCLSLPILSHVEFDALNHVQALLLFPRMCNFVCNGLIIVALGTFDSDDTFY
jgi:hypothetical protein